MSGGEGSLFGDWPVLDAGMNFEAAQTALEAAGLGDGLPLVPPTRARLDAMLAGVRDPVHVHGQLPTLFGEITAAAVAYNCVLAGCAPGAVPLVLTAATACLEPKFNALGLLTTTGSAAVAMLVHGPVAMQLGLNASTNCLGPGNRANATLGRALSLVLRNIGGARENIGDMATMGQPGKYTFCFAEGPASPFAHLHVRRGLAIDRSAVTVLGVSGTAEILPRAKGDTPDQILDPIAHAMVASVATYSSSAREEGPEQIVLLPPEVADRLAASGLDLFAVQASLYARGLKVPRPETAATTPIARSAADIHPIVTGGAGQKITYLPLWGGGSFTVTKALAEP